MRIQTTLFFICVIFSQVLFAQNDTYYSTINTSNSTFITELQTRIRSPYTKISYNQFDETNVTNFAARDTTNGDHVVTCVYSGEDYVYSGTFSWLPFSREHTWCHSWMPTYDSESGEEYSDQHHLFPTNQNNANGVRNNHPLGLVSTVTSTYLECKYGKNTANEVVFEPRESHKGDAARALLYMSLRYNEERGDWTFDHLNTVTLPGLSEAPQNLELLIQWHKEDPPSKWEVERNDYIESIQGNRNPFTDHPEYINYINFYDLTKLDPAPVYAVQPTNFPTSFNAVNSSTSITVSWVDAVAGTQAPTKYLLEAYNKDTYFIPIDGDTYTEDTDLSDGKAVVYIDYSAGNTYTFNNLNNGETYYFKIYSLNGSGTSINYKIEGSSPSTSAIVVSSLADEPTNYITNLNTSNITSTSIQLNWTNAVGDILPSGYLIKINNTDSFTDPSDGATYSNDLDFSDGEGLINIPHSTTQFAEITGLEANTTYYVKMYSYNGNTSIRNYKTDGTVPNNSAKTSTISSYSTILLDNFNETNNNTVGTNNVGTVWNETETVSNSSIQINNNNLKLSSIIAGREFAYIDLSSLNGYKTTLNQATGIMTWAFNFKHSQDNPSGFGNGNYAIAFVLAANIEDYVAANGYAIVIGQEYDQDPIRLVYFTNGIDKDSKITNIILGGDYGKEYLSVKVTYNPAGNLWNLYCESNLAATGSFPQSDPRNTSTLIGAANVTNSTYTSTNLSYLGCLWNHATGSSAFAIFDDIYISDPENLLPVELNSFGGVYYNNSIKLDWQTATEINNYGFEIEKSNNLANWQKIGFVNGNGNSNTINTYSFVDNSPSIGSNFYRLKQIDTDGKFTYSKTISVESTISPNEFVLFQNYPNPFNPTTTIKYYVPNKSKISLIVSNVLGEKISTLVNEEKESGYYSTNFNAVNLASGVYYYTLNGEGFSKTQKMIILK